MRYDFDGGFDIMIRRRRLKLTQEALAEMAGCSRFYLCTIERGHQRPSDDLMERIDKALKKVKP